jgi:hypothetical protein
MATAHTKVQASVETSDKRVNSVHINNVLDLAGFELSSIGDRFYELEFGTHLDDPEAPPDPQEKHDRFEQAMRERNRSKHFPYPTGGAFLPMDSSDLSESKTYTRNGFFTENKDSEDPTGPFNLDLSTSHIKFNRTASAFFALLASRQYSARSANGYPMTFFVGPGDDYLAEHKKSRKDRNETEQLSRYDRIVFTSSATTMNGDLKNVRWVAIASLPSSSSIPDRPPMVTAWANYVEFEHSGFEKASEYNDTLIVLRQAIGKEVVERWNVIHKSILSDVGVFSTPKPVPYASLLNEKLLKSGSSVFVRSTKSKQMYSVLWPLTQMSMIKDDSVFYDASRLHTLEVAGESNPKSAFHDVNEALRVGASSLEEPSAMEHAWLRWTTAMLSMGTLPYIRHTQVSSEEKTHVVSPIRARPHLEKSKMNALMTAVSKSLKDK